MDPTVKSISSHTLVLISTDTEYSKSDDTWTNLVVPKSPASVISSPVLKVIVFSDSPSSSPPRTTSLRMEGIPPHNGRLHGDTNQHYWASTRLTGGCHAKKKLDMDATFRLPNMRMMAPRPPSTPGTGCECDKAVASEVDGRPGGVEA
ncbi:hypothetical protein CJ030_MR2G004719 [Morella rubra]|uniref:Uncharacterized protein n=1 Tax=Morella rubra TaxID=262757 RepID=A0A6A1WFR8_9ROSI|nr:hypothetical protein CJ030_MR2G004719 [Morella rubra]